MKISHLLLALVSISLTVISTRAGSLDNSSECVKLPAFTVEALRQTPAERQIARNLDEIRATARTAIPVKTEIPLLDAKREAGHEASKAAPVLVVAKS